MDINDTPLLSAQHDVLGRSAFAKSIYELALGATDETSIRIGVYADWGQGKTSVLNMVEVNAKADGALVMRFDPWTAKTPTHLWGLFVQQLRDLLARASVSDSSVEEPHAQPGRIRRAAKTLVSAGRTLTSIAGPAKRFFDMLADVADEKLAGDVKTVLKLLSEHDNRKIIVLVDELDRTAPTLVPEVLLTIRSILDIPGFSFVLAFDEKAVQHSLGQTNGEWGQNLRFLEKVIEYPRHLPPIDSRTTLRFAEVLRHQHAPWLPTAVLENLEPLLPRNPRRLKLYFRNLLLAGRQIERFGKHEIDYGIIALTNLLRTQSPSLAEAIFSDSDFWSQMGIARAAMYRHTAKEPAPESIAFDERVNELLESHGLAGDVEAERIEQTLQRFVSTAYRRDLVLRCAYLADSPPGFSSSEVLALTGLERDELARRIEQHAADRARTRVDVCAEAFSVGVGAWGWKMAEAADASLRDDTEAHALSAISVVRLLSSLTDLAEGAFGERELREGLAVAVQWAHFTNLNVYKDLREEEASLLVKLASQAETSALAMARTTRESNRVLHRDDTSRLLSRIHNALEPKIAELILTSLDFPDLFSSLVSIANAAEVHPVLFNGSSFFWRDYRDAFLKRCRERAPERCTSFMEFVSRLGEYASSHSAYCSREQVEKLMQDDEVVLAAWDAALVRPAQPRQVGELLTAFDQFTALRGKPLPLPPWTEEEFALRLKSE